MADEKITVDEVKARMDRGDPIQFVDSRNPQAWSDATTKLPGAIRVAASQAEQHVGELDSARPVVTYCT